MGKSFKGFSKALSLILALAMVVTCVPTSAYAAELLSVDESEDLLISNDALVEESSEETSSTSIDTQKEADLAAAPEENTAGEEEIGPDQYTGDAKITVANYDTPGTDRAGIFTVNGSTATLVDDANIVYDSDDDQDIYIAPVKGYKLKTEPFTLTAGWKKTSTSDAISYADYTAAKTAGIVSETSAADISSTTIPAAYDGSKAVKITFKKTSALATAFAENEVEAYTTAPSVSLDLQASASDQAEAVDVPVFIYEPGVTTFGNGTKINGAKYDADWTGTSDAGISIVGSSFDWTGVTAEVGILKGFDEDDKAEWDTAAWTAQTFNTSWAATITALKTNTTSDSYYLADGKIAINEKGINDAYAKVLSDGYELAVVLTRSEEAVAKVHNFTATESDYYEIKGSAITAGKVTEAASGFVYVQADVAAGTIATHDKRELSKVYYKVGSAEEVEAASIAESDISNDFKIAGETEALDDDSKSEAATAANAAGWRKISKAAITDDTIVSATTKETVNFNGIELNGSSSTVTVTTEDAATLKNEAVTISPAITKGSTYSNNGKTTTLTGKPYSFKVVPASGYEVTEVVAKVYGVDGVGFDNIDLTGKGVNGVYTIDSVSANVDITVNTEALGAKEATISRTETSTGVSVVLSATGEPISKIEAPSIKTGTEVKFEATVLPGYWIKKLEYKIGATGTVTELKPAAISPKGVFSYTLDAATVTGQVNLTFTMDSTSAEKRNSVKIVKLENDNATITINGTELKSSEYMIVPTSEELTFTVAGVGNATPDKIYYKAVDNVASPGITDATGATQVTGTSTFTITADTLKRDDRDGTKGIVLIATTTEEVATSEYKVLWDGTAEPNDVDTSKGESLTEVKLVAGGSDTEAAIADEASKSLKNIDIKASDTITATVVKASDGKTAVTGIATGTYKLGITGANAVAAVSGTNTVTTTNKSGEDTLSVEFATTSTFPHTKTYESSIPVKVAALNTVYATEGFSLKSVVASNGAASTVTTAGLDSAGTTIRVKRTTAPSIDDYITLNPQFTDENDDETENTNDIKIDAGSSDDSLIKSITWAAKSSTGEAYDPDFLAPTYGLYTTYSGTAYDGTSSNNKIALGAPSAAQAVTVTGTITYLDNTTSKVEGIVDIIEDNLGYIGIPVITVGSQEAVYNGASPAAALELATEAGLNKATVKYEVYEVLKNNTVTSVATVATFNGKTAAQIKALVDNGELKAVTSGIDYGDGLKKTTGTDGVVTGIDTPAADGTFTLTAAKAGTINLKPDMSINGVPVAVTTNAVAVSVVSALPSYTVTLKTDYTTSVKTTDYDAPDLKEGAAWLAKAHGTTLGSSKKTPTAYTYKNVAAGTKVTLPTFEDFNIKTFDPKKVLWAWTDNGGTGGVGNSYAPGETVTISGTTIFTPVWVDKYQGGNVYGVIGSGKANITATTNIAVGAKLPIYIKYNALDTDKRAENVEKKAFDGAIGNVTYKTAADYVTSGMELTWTTESGKASIVTEGTDTFITAADAGGADPVLKVEYVEFKDADNEVTYTPASSTNTTTFTVATAQTYTMKVDAIAVEENQVKGVAVDLKLTTGGASTTIALDNTTYLTNTPSNNLKVKVADETVAKVEVDDSNNNLKVTGLKAGGSTTVVLTLTDNKGTVTVSDPITITVSTATKKIVAAPATTDTALWDDTYGVLVDKGTTAESLTFAVETIATGAQVPGTSWTVKNSTPATVEAANNIFDSGHAPTFTDNVLTYTPADKFGQATIDVTATVDGITYLATIPVTSIYRYTYHYGDTTTDIYEGDTKASKDIVKPVIYTGADTYTVPDSNKITAKWTGTGTFEFFGWGTSFKSNGTAEDANAYLAGESYTIKKADLAATTLHAVLGTPSIAVTGLPSEIVLTDETLANGTVAGTDALSYAVSITPATSASPVTVVADKKAFVSLNHGDVTKTAAASRNTYDGSAPTTSVTPTTDKGGTAGQGLLNGTAADGTTTTSRIFTFTVGTANPAVTGTGNLIVGYNGKTTKIPVYVNGEYTDTTVTPNVVRYLEKGENLESGVRTVKGEKHYYKDGAKVLKGAVKIDSGADAGKTVLIVNGKVYSTVGAMAIEDKVYYVGADGFVKTAGLFTGEAAGDKDKSYFANEDGTLVAGELKEISGKSYYFNATGAMEKAASTADKYALSSDGKYYVNADGEVALKGIFKVEGVDRLFTEEGKIVTYADTTDGKITVAGVTYIIDKDTNAAKRDDVLYDAKVTWVNKFPSKWSKTEAIPVITYTITYKSANTGESKTTDSIIATVTPETVASDATEVTFTATADLTGYFADKEGKTPATADILTKKYTFKNGGSEGGSGKEIAEGFTIEGLEEEYYFTGAAIKPAFTVTDDERGVILAKGVDYSVSYKNNTKIGKDTAQITVKGKGNYQGQAKTVTFSIVDPVAAAKEAGEDLAVTVKKINKITESFTYNGEPQWPASVVVETKDAGTITMKHDGNGKYSSEGEKSVAISVANNVEKGSATVTAIGSDNKAKKTTFKIAAVDLSTASTDDLTITAAAAKYTSKGATTTVEVSYKGLDLIEGQDYTVKYAYANKKNAGENAGNVTITGKGNFAKAAAAVPFEIEKFNFTTDLADGFATTAVAGAKPKAIKATVVDLAGNVIPAKAYNLTVEGATGDKLNAGDEITVKIEAADTTNYEGDASVSITVAPDIKKVKYNKKYEKTFTGDPVTLEAEDFEKMGITLNGTALEYGTDFEVVGYAKNVKKGTAQVTIAGASDKAAGTVVLKFKIVAKTIK